MFWIISIYFISLVFGLAITLVEVNLGSRPSLDSVSNFQPGFLIMWPLYSLLQLVDCDAFTLALWQLLIMSVWLIDFSSLMFPSSTCACAV